MRIGKLGQEITGLAFVLVYNNTGDCDDFNFAYACSLGKYE
jgi:hypothetical protein